MRRRRPGCVGALTAARVPLVHAHRGRVARGMWTSSARQASSEGTPKAHDVLVHISVHALEQQRDGALHKRHLLCYCHRLDLPFLLAMRPFTLVTKKLYFGVDAQRMRDSSARVLARLETEGHGRGVVRFETLVEAFGLSAAASRPMIDEMLHRGLLEQQDTRGGVYGITDK